MMRRTLSAVLSSALLALALTLAVAPAANAQTAREAAAKELLAGARAYREGRFAEAEQRFRQALELDPSQKNAPLFIARAIQQQYKHGDTSPENVATGERAVAAYQDILNRDPQDEDAYKAMVFLYGKLGRWDRVEDVLSMRANDPAVSAEKRAEALVILASRRWQCSYDVTGPEEKWTGATRRRPRIDAGDLIKARQCVDEGMAFIEQSVSLDPKGPLVWAYKAHLVREASKLAEVEGDAGRKADYDMQYEEALDSQKRVTAEAERDKRPGQKPSGPVVTSDPPSDPAPAAKPHPGGES